MLQRAEGQLGPGKASWDWGESGKLDGASSALQRGCLKGLRWRKLGSPNRLPKFQRRPWGPSGSLYACSTSFNRAVIRGSKGSKDFS